MNHKQTKNNNNKTKTPREYLEYLYHKLNGPNWIRQDNWLSDDTSVDISHWSGVTCDNNKTGGNNIIGLELSQNNLKGEINEQLVENGFPSSLEQLWLSENQLTGNLPASLADETKFPRLNILDVGSNQLKGSLHPMFASASTRFSWFDITDNQLTSYFRYNNNNNNDNNNQEEKDTTTTTTTTPTTTNPLPFVYVVESLLSIEACHELIQLALDYTTTNGAWQTTRHKEFPTTDLDIAYVGGQLLERCNHWLQHAILPALCRCFDHFELSELAIEDLFLVQYSHNQQRGLPPHRDGSELSFVITLNCANDDYEGGGTQFFVPQSGGGTSTTTTISPTIPGTSVLFCGRIQHSGIEVTKGTRYILAGFVRVYPTTSQSETKLQEILKSCSSSEGN